MNKTSRTITGITMILLGLVLTVVAFFEAFFILIYGVPLLIVGIVILLNKKEDEIEQIKSRRRSKK